MTEYCIYEIWQDGARVASCCGPDETAFKEAEHYAMVYGRDGPVEIRRKRQRAAPVTNREPASEANYRDIL
jgi:hypothetical protein